MMFHRFLLLFALQGTLSIQASAQDSLLERLVNPRAQVLKVREIAPITSWVEDSESLVKERAETALGQGAEALEKLAAELAADEPKDRDGRYTLPLFYEVITGTGQNIRGQNRLDYQLKVCAEWRKQFPESKAAVLAEGRLWSIQAYYAIHGGRAVPDMDQSWKVAGEFITRSQALLEECKDLRKTDPSWYAAYFQLVVKGDPGREEFQKVADALVKDFPDDALSLSKAVKCLYPESFGKPGEWEPWLQGQLKGLSADAKAKQYARVLIEIGATDGFNTEAGPTHMWGSRIDSALMASGMELLAKQYPESTYILSADASAGAFCLRDRKLAFKYLKLLGGRAHRDHFYSEGRYDAAVGFVGEVPWNLAKTGGPRITHPIYGNDDAFKKEMDETAEKGPAALEELIQELRSTAKGRDKDGLYQSVRFFDWFAEKPRNLAQEKRRIRKEALLKQWAAESPASPFAKLASATYWAHHAWNSRGGWAASSVDDVQWKGFEKRLKLARKDLMASKELRDSEPAWCETALMMMKGEGPERAEFEDISAVVFEKFPECDAAVGQTMENLLPKWQGKAGMWEPWMRGKLKDLPEDERCMAYASAIITVHGYAKGSKTNFNEVFGSRKPDVPVLMKGLALLAAKYPDSIRIANAQAMFGGAYTDDSAAVYKALEKMNGTLDLRVWYSYSSYEPCERWVARLRTEAALKAAE